MNEILVFAKVVDEKSFTSAAKALGLPKSTVSRKVAQLEERLGAQLLHRTTRTLRLTEVGAAYYQRCARITAELAEAEREVLDLSTTPRGRMRITAPTELSVLGELAGRFLALYPQVELDIELTGRAVDLVEEGYDLAIRAGRLVDSSLIARKLGLSVFILCAAPSYLDQHGSPQSIDDLRHHRCIIFGSTQRRYSWHLARRSGVSGMSGAPSSQRAGDTEQTTEVPIRGPLATNNLSLVRDAAIAGVGIALLPPPMCAPHLESGRLREVLCGTVAPMGSIYAVYPATHRHSLKVRAILEFLTTQDELLPWTTQPAAARQLEF